MPCVAVDAKSLVLEAIRKNAPRPTELLQLLGNELSYTEIQDALGELLGIGAVELGSDRHLRIVLAAAS